MGFPFRLEGPCHLQPEHRALQSWEAVRASQQPSSFCSCLPLLFLVPGGLVGDLRPLGKCELPCKLMEKAGFWSCRGEGFPQSSSGCVGLGESSVELWPNLSWLSPLTSGPSHTPPCVFLPAGGHIDRQCTPWVEPRLCWPPMRAVLLLLSQSVPSLLIGPSPDLFGFRNLPCPAMFLS